MNKKKFRFCIRNVLSVYLAKKMSEAVIYLIGFFFQIGRFCHVSVWKSDFMGAAPGYRTSWACLKHWRCCVELSNFHSYNWIISSNFSNILNFHGHAWTGLYQSISYFLIKAYYLSRLFS